jgi:hypothetical protein
MKRFFKGIAFLGILFFAVSLSGCGGGGGSSPGGSSRTSVYITDAPIAGYSQVLVTVLSADLRNSATGASAPVVDFTSTGAMSFDLTDLAGVLRLVNVTNIPVGTYDRVAVLLANSISLRDAAGNLVVAKFAPVGDTYLLIVNANITIHATPTGTLVLDFDLTQFSFDPLTGIVNAVVIPDDSMDDHSTYGRLDEVEGAVVSVDQANSRLTLNLEHSTINLTVLVDANTVCTGEGIPLQGTACFQMLTAGAQINVKGLLDLASASIQAAVIKSDHRVSGDPSRMDKVEGVISSVDVGNGTFTVFVSEAEGFVPVLNPDGTLTVRVSQSTLWDNLAGINSLVPQMAVESLGNWTGSEFAATKVEPEGADDDAPFRPGPEPGNCTTIPQKTLADYGSVMMPVFEVEHISLSGLSTGTDISVSAGNGQTYFITTETKLEKGPSDHICVEDLSAFVGNEIEIKYVLGSSAARVAVKLEVK